MSALTVDEMCELVVRTFSLPSADVQEETTLFSSGLLDSFHLVELIAVLEKASGRKIRPGDVSLENLDTPRRIAAFLATDA